MRSRHGRLRSRPTTRRLFRHVLTEIKRRATHDPRRSRGNRAIRRFIIRRRKRR